MEHEIEYDKQTKSTKDFQHVRVFQDILDDEFCDSIVQEYKEGKGEISNKIKDLFPYDNSALEVIIKTIFEDYRAENDYLLRSPVDLQGMNVIRYKQGVGVPPHSSRVGTIAISFVAFMNDDFEGGKLYFPDHGMEVTPKKGSIVMFPSTYLMPHAVSDIMGNERYVIIGGINLK